MASVTAVKRLSEFGPRGLAIVLSEHGTATTIVLEGEWDLAQQQATRETIRAALDRSPESVVLDLSRVSFIDSSGLHVLVELHKRAESENVRLAIVPGPRPVQRLFEVSGLLDVLPFVGAGDRDWSHETPQGAPCNAGSGGSLPRHGGAGRPQPAPADGAPPLFPPHLRGQER